MRRIAVLQYVNHPQGLAVMVETAFAFEQFIENILPGMSERRMPQVMHERYRLGQVFVEAKVPGYRAAYLGDLDSMCESRAKVIGFVRDKHLSLVFQSAEGGGVDDAVAVALKVGAKGVFFLRVHPAAALSG